MSDLFTSRDKCMLEMQSKSIEVYNQIVGFSKMIGKVPDCKIEQHGDCIYIKDQMWKIIEFPKTHWWKPKFDVHDIIRKGNTTAIVCNTNDSVRHPDWFGYCIVVFGSGSVPDYKKNGWRKKWPKDTDHWISEEDEENWCKIDSIAYNNDEDMIRVFAKYFH